MITLHSKHNSTSMSSVAEELADIKERLAEIELRKSDAKTKKAIQDLLDTLHRKLNDIKDLITEIAAESDEA